MVGPVRVTHPGLSTSSVWSYQPLRAPRTPGAPTFSSGAPLFLASSHPVNLRLLSWSPTTPLNSPSLLALLETRSLRTHPFAPYSSARPGETPLRTALSPRYLIRMRSQVQVLAAHHTSPDQR